MPTNDRPKDFEIEKLRQELIRMYDEDAAQEGIVRGLKAWDKGKLGSSLGDFRAWVWRVAQSRYFQGKKWESRSDGDGAIADILDQINPAVLTENRELLAELRLKYPKVVHLFETGEGAENPTVRKQLSRLREKGIRGFLDELDEAR